MPTCCRPNDVPQRRSPGTRAGSVSKALPGKFHKLCKSALLCLASIDHVAHRCDYRSPHWVSATDPTGESMATGFWVLMLITLVLYIAIIGDIHRDLQDA
ncbi:hypothetical protein GCM10009744_59360 [Kribbella alba]|uniref:Uncharacterized protein n=1 Tax=Kribbella alba TaxID=190197 RepID=A0ABN2FTL6_9ACTN